MSLMYWFCNILEAIERKWLFLTRRLEVFYFEESMVLNFVVILNTYSGNGLDNQNVPFKLLI
jgi:hypothetical protein